MYIPLQTPVPPGSQVERLVRLIDALCAAIAARGAGGVLTRPLFFLLWGRLRRTAVRAIRAAARIAAGTPPPTARQRAPCPPRPQPLRLPRGYAWVVRLVPGTAAYGTQLQALLADPDMALLAEAPAMRRLLNPLRQMLGVPKPPSRRSAAAPKPATADQGSDSQPADVDAPPTSPHPEPPVAA